MNPLLTLTAILEAATGLALIAVPNTVVRLLLGGEISGAGIPLGRVAGFGLLSLAIACWPSQGAIDKTASSFWGMLTYNLLATLFFVWLGFGGEWRGPLLWPAAALHGFMSVLLVRQWKLGTGHLKTKSGST